MLSGLRRRGAQTAVVTFRKRNDVLNTEHFSLLEGSTSIEVIESLFTIVRDADYGSQRIRIEISTILGATIFRGNNLKATELLCESDRE